MIAFVQIIINMLGSKMLTPVIKFRTIFFLNTGSIVKFPFLYKPLKKQLQAYDDVFIAIICFCNTEYVAILHEKKNIYTMIKGMSFTALK